MATRKARSGGTIHEYKQVRVSPGRPTQARLDTRSNPLVQAVSQKVKLVTEQRQLTMSQLAETMGVEEAVIRQVWNETALPGPELAYRLLKWFQDPSLTWKFRPRLRRRAAGTALTATNGQWARRIVWLPTPVADKLSTVCASTGYSEEAFMQIAIQRLLEHEPTMTTLKEAVEQLEKVLIQRALNKNPDLWTLLKLEQVPTEMPDKLVNAELDLAPLATQQIAETPVYDGPATLIAVDADLLEEI